MRVDFTNLGLEPPDKGKPGRAGSSTAASPRVEQENAAPESTTGADRAQFSFHQLRVASLEARVQAAPEIRQYKVEPLQQAVASGQYKVDANQVAQAMATEFNNGRVR